MGWALGSSGTAGACARAMGVRRARTARALKAVHRSLLSWDVFRNLVIIVPRLLCLRVGTGSTNRAVAECYFSAVIRVNEDGCGVPIIFRIGCWAVLGA